MPTIAPSDLELLAVESAAQVTSAAKLAEEIWLEHYPTIIGLAQTRYMVERLQTVSAIAIQIARGARYFLLVHRGQEVGYAAIEVRAGALFISKLYLLRDLRGRGLGLRALEAIAAIARAEALARLELTVNRNNTLALRCYARFGMKTEGTCVTDIGEGYVMDDYVLRMELTPL